MQAFVAVGFGRAHPVAQAVGVGLVEVRHNAIHLPAGRFFLLRRHVQNHANGKQIIHLIEGDVLLLHLLQDGIDAFGPALYFILKALRLQLLVNGLHKLLDKAVARALALPHLGLKVVVGLGVGEFEVQILQLTLYSIEAQAVGQRRVQVQRFRGNFELLVARHRVQRPHVVQAVGYFDENHAHVLAQREQHFAEVLGLLAGAVLEHARNLGQPVDNAGHLGAELALNVRNLGGRVLHHVVQQRRHNAGGAQPNFLHRNLGHGQRVQNVGLARLAAHLLVGLQALVEGFFDELRVAILQVRLGGAQQAAVVAQDFLALGFGRDNGRHNG